MSAKPRAPRFTVGAFSVIYDTGDAYWSAPVVDVSESGLFVETVHELPIGTRVTLMPEVPQEEKLPFEINAEVTRVSELDLDEHFDRTPGIAFRLVDLSIENYAQLRSFLKEHGAPVRDGG